VARTVGIPADGVELAADLVIPANASGIVAFAHGSGSGRGSPRNQKVAERLQREGLATLLLDLLTEPEEQRDLQSHELRFDVWLLARRLTAAIDWLAAEASTASLRAGCFGASTGAAAALIAAAHRPGRIGAVVSRGGRPDLANAALPEVSAPTLLIVGGADQAVLELNRQAQRAMLCPTHLEVIPDATHLFEEPGALDTVAELACEWFSERLDDG
jgi:dienelactone hydrolase